MRGRALLAIHGGHATRKRVLQDVTADESLGGASVYERDKTKNCRGGDSAKHGNFDGKIGVVERNRAADEARAVLGEGGRVRGGERGARGDSQHIRAVVRRRIGKMGRKLRRRTGASM